MRARSGGLIVGVLATIFAASTAMAANDNVLHVYNWSDYIAKDTIQKFEKATGIKVTYDVYDGNEVLEAKLMAGHSGYDVVVPSAFPFLQRQVKAGIYRKLDKSRIPNYSLQDPRLLKMVAVADPGNEHAAIYMWGTTGIGYNEKKIKQRMPNAPVDSMAMVFDPAVVKHFKDCGVTFLDSPTDVVPMALQYLGLDPNSEKPADLDKAQALLLKVRPYIKYFHSSQYINDLANGDVCVSIGWSGDVFQAADRADQAKNGVVVDYVIPKEGTVLWLDNMAVPADAPHPDNAFKFINFILQPQIEADITNYVAYANPVPSSLPKVDPDIKNNPGVYPPDAVMNKLFVGTPKTQTYNRLLTRLWTKVRTGQ